MRQRPQRVRLGFLIVLTLMVLVFGVVNLLRTYRGSQERTTIVRTEQQVRTVAEGALRTEHEQLVRFARDELGRTGRDAAALLAQVRWLEAVSAQPPGRRPNVDLAARSGQIQQNLARIQAGAPAVFPRGEPFLRACYSPVDGALLSYGVVVPGGYMDSFSYPLIVTLDGDFRGPLHFQDTPPYGGAISVLASPGPAGEFGDGDVAELVAVLRDVALTYNIDPQRVYLIGHEHGADAAWQAAVSYPELFAGLVLFDVTRGCPAATLPSQPAIPRAPTLRQMLDFVEAALCPDSYVRNLSHAHVVLLQNAGGDRAALQGARALAARLRTAGVSVEYLEFPFAPGQPFPDWTQQYAVAAVMSHAGTLRPQEFSYRTAAIRGRHAWWVRLDALGGQPARFATVTGRLQDGMAEVTTDNVSALTVVPERLPEGVDAIRVDGMQFNVPTKPLALVRRGGIWRAGAARGLLKREDLSGPFSDVLRGQSLIVYGTAGDDDLRKQMVRDEAMRLAADAGSRYGLKATVKPDTEVTDEDRARVNLVLIGGPDVNAVSAAGRRLAAGQAPGRPRARGRAVLRRGRPRPAALLPQPGQPGAHGGPGRRRDPGRPLPGGQPPLLGLLGRLQVVRLRRLRQPHRRPR